MYYTKVKILKSLFSFTLRLLSRERTLIDCLPYTVSKLPSNLCMPILIFFPNWQLNNNQPQKHGYPPEEIRENAIRSEKFRYIYNF